MKPHVLAIMMFIVLIVGGRCLAQEQVDAVILHNGSKILGTIIEQVPNKSLKIKTKDGSEFVYTFDEIEIIRKENVEGMPGYSDTQSYPELGVNFGTPAGINFAMGYQFGLVGLRLSGMIWGRPISGLQMNVGFRLSDNADRSHVVAAILGSMEVEEDLGFSSRMREWNYVGAVYELNLSGFFLQAGATVGSGDFSSPQLVFQIGYMHRFF